MCSMTIYTSSRAHSTSFTVGKLVPGGAAGTRLWWVVPTAARWRKPSEVVEGTAAEVALLERVSSGVALPLAG
jgi:hypothetical protein